MARVVLVYVEADLGTRMGVVFWFWFVLEFGAVFGAGVKLWVVVVVGVFGGAVVVMVFGCLRGLGFFELVDGRRLSNAFIFLSIFESNSI